MEFTVSGEVDLDVLLGRNEEDRAGFTSINVVADIESPDLNKEESSHFSKKSIADARFETVLNGSPFSFSISS